MRRNDFSTSFVVTLVAIAALLTAFPGLMQ